MKSKYWEKQKNILYRTMYVCYLGSRPINRFEKNNTEYTCRFKGEIPWTDVKETQEGDVGLEAGGRETRGEWI